METVEHPGKHGHVSRPAANGVVSSPVARRPEGSWPGWLSETAYAWGAGGTGRVTANPYRSIAQVKVICPYCTQ